MRASLFGILAVFAVGCGSGPATFVDSTASAEKLAPCVGQPCGQHDFSRYWKLDPVELAQEWGRPEIASAIAELATPARERLGRAASFTDAQQVIEQLYGEIDKLAAAH